MPGLRPLSWAEGTNPKPKFIANPLYIWHLSQHAHEREVLRCLRSSIARPENDARGAEAAASDSRSEIGGRRRLNILFPGRECSPGRRLRPRSASVPALGAQGPRRREKSPPSTPLFVIHK